MLRRGSSLSAFMQRAAFRKFKHWSAGLWLRSQRLSEWPLVPKRYRRENYE